MGSLSRVLRISSLKCAFTFFTAFRSPDESKWKMNQLSPWLRISCVMLPGCWVISTAPRSYLRPSLTHAIYGPHPKCPRFRPRLAGPLPRRQRRDRLRDRLSELLLVVIEHPLEEKPRQHERLMPPDLRHVDDADLPFLEGGDEHVHELTARVVEHPHDPRHVRPSGDGLSLLIRVQV